jgi:predicted amidophosphoribosyltransferase
VFDDIKNYFHFDNTKKTCALCNDGLPLKTYTTCDGCQKFFCLKHRPMFQKQWFCPHCEENFKAYLTPLKTSNIKEFFNKIF